MIEQKWFGFSQGLEGELGGAFVQRSVCSCPAIEGKESGGFMCRRPEVDALLIVLAQLPGFEASLSYGNRVAGKVPFLFLVFAFYCNDFLPSCDVVLQRLMVLARRIGLMAETLWSIVEGNVMCDAKERREGLCPCLLWDLLSSPQTAGASAIRVKLEWRVVIVISHIVYIYHVRPYGARM